MILVPFFEIPYGDRLAKNVNSQCVQVIPRSTVTPTLSTLTYLKNGHVNLLLRGLVRMGAMGTWHLWNFQIKGMYENHSLENLILHNGHSYYKVHTKTSNFQNTFSLYQLIQFQCKDSSKSKTKDLILFKPLKM